MVDILFMGHTNGLDYVTLHLHCYIVMLAAVTIANVLRYIVTFTLYLTPLHAGANGVV